MILVQILFWLLAIWMMISIIRARSRPVQGPPARDISGIASDGDGNASETKEEIQTGGPLKAGHRRLALRDPRLLPKTAPAQPYRWPRPEKKRYFSEEEADRLFSPTMRTSDRNIRDLMADEEQLARYGLPVWRTEAELAGALGVSLKRLQYLATHRLRDSSLHYVAFAVAKRNGGTRIIHAPKRGLKAVQRQVNDLLVSKLPVSPHAHGFLKGRSVATNAAPHVGKAVVIKFDVKDCFPTIHYGRVRGLFIALGYSYPVATSLAVLMTEAPRQKVHVDNNVYHVPTGPRVCVQGAPTSPGLCNAIMRRLDLRLAGLAAKHGFSFTRYADDLTFSGDDPAKVADLKAGVEKIVAAEGFTLNRDKTHIMRKGSRQSVTGVVVNEVAGLSRQDRRKLRAEIHQLNRKTPGDREQSRATLQGKLAYLHMLNPEQAERLAKRLASA